MLDLICTRNIFACMNLSWHIVKFLVHVYLKILWENMYKISYAMICDGFIARIYFIIFRKECPRISVVAKKMISKVGHWYFEETSIYIRLFGDTVHPTYSSFMSQIISYWEIFVTKPFYKVIMLPW
jgi:hypothetical protein